MTTERQRQARAAFASDRSEVIRWHFSIDSGARTFSAIALAEGGALRVLDAEHPQILPVRFIGPSVVYGDRVAQRKAYS